MISAKLTGDQALIARLNRMPTAVHTRLAETVKGWSIRLTAYVKDQKLSGQVLHVRSGTLRRKIHPIFTDTDVAVTGGAGVKLAYARLHEFGFDGMETVRAHVRRVASRSARGWVLTSYTDAKRTQVAQGIAFVRSFQRHVKMPERSYLRSSLRDNAPAIMTDLRAAVAEGLRAR